MSLQPGTVIDRYTVEAVLGAGGIAVVYRVRHNTLDSLHALKVLTITSAAIRQRLIQEGRVQASLRHPNILAVTDIVEVDGAPGLIMEYVEGPTLEILLQRERLPFDRAEKLGLGIIAGVSEAHARGLIHRDLKPANVLLAMAGASYVPKVADFGLVKLLTEGGLGLSSTRTGLTMGTPRYMAPEQIRDAKNVDQRADIFSLGAVLYELVTGQQTFPGDDVIDLFNNIASGNFVRPKKLVPTLSSAVEEAIIGALEVDRDERIPDCQTLLSTWTGGDQSDSRIFIRPSRPSSPVKELAVEPAEPKIRPGWHRHADKALDPIDSSAPPSHTLPPPLERPRRSAPAIERPAIKVVTLPTDGGVSQGAPPTAPPSALPSAPVVPPPPMVPPPMIPSAFSLPPTPSLVGGMRGFPSPIREAPIRDSAPRPVDIKGDLKGLSGDRPATPTVQPELRPAPIVDSPPTDDLPASPRDRSTGEHRADRAAEDVPTASIAGVSRPGLPAAPSIEEPSPTTEPEAPAEHASSALFDTPTAAPGSVEDEPKEEQQPSLPATPPPHQPAHQPQAAPLSAATPPLKPSEQTTLPPGPRPSAPSRPIETPDPELDALVAKIEREGGQGSGKAWALVGLGGMALVAALAIVVLGVFWFIGSGAPEETPLDLEVAGSEDPPENTEETPPHSTTPRTEAVAAAAASEPVATTTAEAAPPEAAPANAASTDPAPAAKAETTKAETTKAGTTKTETRKAETAKTGSTKTETTKTETAKKEASKKKDTPAKVTVQGEVANVIFRGEKGSYHAGDVPPGDYEIKADFGTGKLESAGQIHLKAGQSLTVKCSSRLLVCR